MQPETRYARLGGDRIAYQVLGQGPLDLVMTTGGFSQIDIIWEDPGIALFLRTLASFSRLILFDRRGTGASDPPPPDPLPPWESYAEELVAVMDEVGCERAALLAQVDAGPLALFFAGSRPDRTSALILAHTTAKFAATDDYPIGVPAEGRCCIWSSRETLTWRSPASFRSPGRGHRMPWPRVGSLAPRPPARSGRGEGSARVHGRR